MMYICPSVHPSLCLFVCLFVCLWFDFKPTLSTCRCAVLVSGAGSYHTVDQNGRERWAESMFYGYKNENKTHTHTHTHTHIGQLLKYDDGHWAEVAPGNRLKLTKTEGQVWLTLYHLLMYPDCQQKYQFNQHNKNTILKVEISLPPSLPPSLPSSLTPYSSLPSSCSCVDS